MDSDVNVTAVEWETGERFVSLRRALGVTSFGLNQITLQPGQRGRIHRHREQEEVYLVLRGSLTVAVENESSSSPRGRRSAWHRPRGVSCSTAATDRASPSRS